MKQTKMKNKIFLVTLIVIVGCTNATQVAEEKPTDSIPAPTVRYKKWSAYETNLPKGVITGGESTDSGNWLSIEREDGMSTVVKDIDPAVWGAVNKFDTIQ